MAQAVANKNLSIDGYGNLNYYIYTPEHIDSNTPIILYEHGAGGGNIYADSATLLNELNTNGSNAIVLFYNRDAYSTFDASNLINAVSQEYGVPVDNYRCAAHSFGFTSAMTTTANLVQQHPDMEPQAIMMLDGYWPYNNLNKIDQAAQTLGSKGTVMFAFHACGITCNDQYYQKWAGYGMNIFKLYDLRKPDHAGMNQSYVNNDLLAFHAGVGTFPEVHNEWLGKELQSPAIKGYTAVYYDAATGKEVPVDISGMTLEQVYNMCGIDGFSAKLSNLSSLGNVSVLGLSSTAVGSDSQVLAGYLNDIIGQVKSSSFLSYNYSTDFSSTTNVPKQIPIAVKNYFSSTADLLQKIAYDTYQFAKIGESYDQMDAAMSQEASTLGEEALVSAPLAASGIVAGSALKEGKNASASTTQMGTSTPNPSTANRENTTGMTGNTTGGQTPKEGNTIKGNQGTTYQKVSGTNHANRGQNTASKPFTNQNNQTSTTNKIPTSNQRPASSNENVSHSSNQYQSSGSSQNEQTATEQSSTSEFQNYEEIYSDENTIVYNYNDEYKIVVHKDGNRIIGIEHYYDFGTKEDALKAINRLQSDYQNDQYFKEIVSNDRYVKVVIDESMYENLTVDDIMKKYADLSEIIKL